MIMRIILTIGLSIIAIALFIAVKKKWINNTTWQIVTGVSGVVSAIAAVAVFIVPAATSNDTQRATPTNTPDIQITSSPAVSTPVTSTPLLEMPVTDPLPEAPVSSTPDIDKVKGEENNVSSEPVELIIEDVSGGYDPVFIRTVEIQGEDGRVLFTLNLTSEHRAVISLPPGNYKFVYLYQDILDPQHPEPGSVERIEEDLIIETGQDRIIISVGADYVDIEACC